MAHACPALAFRLAFQARLLIRAHRALHLLTGVVAGLGKAGAAEEEEGGSEASASTPKRRPRRLGISALRAVAFRKIQ
ncbi:hypothetical protein D9M70_652520 [compost metagenome]